MTDKERREWYLAHGICPHCGRNDLQKGYKRCLECRMKDNEAHRNKPISEERKAYQREYQREYSKKRREELKAAGICIRCGKCKTDGEHAHCAVCRAKKAAEQREYNRKQGMMPIELRGYGYCTICYTPTENKVCEACHARLVEHAAMMREKQSLKHHIWQQYNKFDVKRIEYVQTNGESR